MGAQEPRKIEKAFLRRPYLTRMSKRSQSGKAKGQQALQVIVRHCVKILTQEGKIKM